MSTKATRELIARAKAEWPDAGGHADRALLEIAAIEAAARHFVEIWGDAGDGNPAEVLIRAIAMEDDRKMAP